MARPSLMTLAANSLIRASRSSANFVRIYWLPFLIGTLLTMVANLIWFDRFPSNPTPPRWLGDLIWAPFGAAITVLAFRYFATGRRESPLSIDPFSTGFLLLMLIHFIWYSVHSQTFDWLRDLSYSALNSAGSISIYGVPTIMQTPWIASAIGFGWVCAFLLIKTTITLAFIGYVWHVSVQMHRPADGPAIFFNEGSVRLFLYLLLFEVALYQLEVFYSVPHFWLASLFPALPGAVGWRSMVMPELWFAVAWLPMALVGSLIWLSAVAEFFLQHEGADGASDKSSD